MMGVGGLFIATILPFVLGYAWLNRWWRDAHPAARIGYGYLLGVLFVVALLWMTDWLTGSLWKFEYLVILLMAFTALAYFIPPPSFPISSPAREMREYSGWQKWVWWFFGVILVVRYGGLVLEVLLRPLFPWDAWMNWAPKAKTWFHLNELVPFVSNDQWESKSITEDARALGNPDAASYPSLVPLIQTWSALGLGTWRDNWINVPWVMCALAFFLAFYGQLRTLGFSPVAAMIPSYLLFSTPYLNTHVALAGYADLWMAAYYTSAVLAFASWSITGSRMQLALLLLMGIACVMTKRPGLVWALTLAPGMFLVLLPAKVRYLILGGVAVLALGVWLNGGLVIPWNGESLLVLNKERLSILSILDYDLRYHPVGEYFLKNLLYRDNWHLLGWAMLVLLPVAFVRALSSSRLLPFSVVVLIGLAFIFFVFFFTHYYRAAIDSTTINRAIFHIMPSLLSFVIITFGSFFLRENGSYASAIPKGSFSLPKGRH